MRQPNADAIVIDGNYFSLDPDPRGRWLISAKLSTENWRLLLDEVFASFNIAERNFEPPGELSI